MSNKKYTLLNDYHLLSYEKLDSTNEEAKRLAEGGSSHGAVVWAKEQSDGRGRMGRDWVSDEGNLFVSFLLSPHEKKNLSNIIYITSCAIQKTLDAVFEGKKPVKFKWPNDVIVDGKKLGGVLIEKIEANDQTWLIVGIGINVNSAPENVMYPATSLVDSGVEIISAKIVLTRLIHHFIEEYDEWIKSSAAGSISHWKENLEGIGQMVEVAIPGKIMAGKFHDVDEHGNMILELADGRREVVTSADVFFKQD